MNELEKVLAEAILKKALANVSHDESHFIASYQTLMQAVQTRTSIEIQEKLLNKQLS